MPRGAVAMQTIDLGNDDNFPGLGSLYQPRFRTILVD
jgi:hypothetical protein